MTKSKILSYAVASVLVANVGQTYAAVKTTWTWTGAAADNNFQNAANYTTSVASGDTGTTSTFPGQQGNGQDAVIFTGAGSTLTTAAATLQPSFVATFTTATGSPGFSIGSPGTATTVITNSGYQWSDQTGSGVTTTANVNFQANTRTVTTNAPNYFFNSFANFSTNGTFVLNGNYSSLVTAADYTSGTRFILQFKGLGARTVNGVISDTGPNAGLIVVLANSNTVNTQAGATTFTNANTYSGTTYVSGSALVATNTTGSATGTSAVIVTNRDVTATNGAAIALTGPVNATGTVGILAGTGTIGGTIDVQGTGSLRPGLLPAGSIGELKSSSTSSTALVLETGSTSLFDINGSTTKGTDYDAFTTAGTVTLGGALTLNVSALPTGAATYNLFNFAGQTGDFNSIVFTGLETSSLSTVAGSGVWTGTLGGLSATFTDATGALVVVPEPASIGALGLMGLTLVSRRRRQS